MLLKHTRTRTRAHTRTKPNCMSVYYLRTVQKFKCLIHLTVMKYVPVQ